MELLMSHKLEDKLWTRVGELRELSPMRVVRRFIFFADYNSLHKYISMYLYEILLI